MNKNYNIILAMLILAGGALPSCQQKKEQAEDQNILYDEKVTTDICRYSMSPSKDLPSPTHL